MGAAAGIMTISSVYMLFRGFTPFTDVFVEHSCNVKKFRVSEYPTSWGENFCPILLVSIVGKDASEDTLHQATRYKNCRTAFSTRLEADYWLAATIPALNSTITCFQYEDGTVKIDPGRPSLASSIALLVIFICVSVVLWIVSLYGAGSLFIKTVCYEETEFMPGVESRNYVPDDDDDDATENDYWTDAPQ